MRRKHPVPFITYPMTPITMISRALPQEVQKQAKMSAPLAADLVLTHSLTLISLAWVAQLGTQPLAAAALAAACYTMLGRLIISGLCGALDTQAAQVSGQRHTFGMTLKDLKTSHGWQEQQKSNIAPTAAVFSTDLRRHPCVGIWRGRCGVAAHHPAALSVLLPAALCAADSTAAGHANDFGRHWCGKQLNSLQRLL